MKDRHLVEERNYTINVTEAKVYAEDGGEDRYVCDIDVFLELGQKLGVHFVPNETYEVDHKIMRLLVIGQELKVVQQMLDRKNQAEMINIEKYNSGKN